MIKCWLFKKKNWFIPVYPHTDRIFKSTYAQTFARLKLNYLCPRKTNNIYFLSLEFNIFHFNVFYESLLLNFVAALFLIKRYAFAATGAWEILNIRCGNVFARNFLILFIRTGVFVEMLWNGALCTHTFANDHIIFAGICVHFYLKPLPFDECAVCQRR